MNETLLSRIGKVFFPRLAPDQRHRRMFTILLISSVCLFSIGMLCMWIMSNRGIHLTTSQLKTVPDVIPNQ